VATTGETGVRASAWHGGFGRLWGAAVLSSFGVSLRTAALLAVTLTLAVAGAPLGALLGGAVATARGANTPAPLTAAFFVLSVLALIPGRARDVSVDAPDGDVTTAHVPR